MRPCSWFSLSLSSPISNAYLLIVCVGLVVCVGRVDATTRQLLDIAYELLSHFLFRTHMHTPPLSFAHTHTRTDTPPHTHTNACTVHTCAHTRTRKPTHTRGRTHMRPHRHYLTLLSCNMRLDSCVCVCVSGWLCPWYVCARV